MCRLLGIVASELTEFGLALTDAPRSLARLSAQHPDGWGIAVHDARAKRDQAWQLHKGVDPAAHDRRFHEVAGRSRGHSLVAHIRQKTVGPTRLENTHPFVRDGWVFAHNGTITEQDELRARSSAHRLREITGETDSELLFAHLLTRLDEGGGTPTDILEAATSELRAKRIGAFNFLLSNGETTFAHRFGRTLFVLERAPDDPVRQERRLVPGTSIVTKWTQRRRAIFIASERITDEPWRELPEGTLVRIDRTPKPTVVPVVAPPVESEVMVSVRAASSTPSAKIRSR